MLRDTLKLPAEGLRPSAHPNILTVAVERDSRKRGFAPQHTPLYSNPSREGSTWQMPAVHGLAGRANIGLGITFN